MCMYASQKRQMLQRRGGTFGIPDKTEFNTVTSDFLHPEFNLSFCVIDTTFLCFSSDVYDGFQLSEQIFH